jgi:quercetin dioxygenase-like cupin family protein
MSFTVYDYRTHVRNVLVTPQIRSRFMKMQPGQVAQPHSHDLGHEIFLVLEGRCEFEIDGESQELGPGQMCIALADQIHSLRTVGNEPMTLYLSVTPHIQPTHTGWTADGQKVPPRFAPSSAYDVHPDLSISLEELMERHAEEAEAVAQAARANADVQREMAMKLRKAISKGDGQAATEARNAMWEAIYTVYRQLYDSGDVWNALAPRITEGE